MMIQVPEEAASEAAVHPLTSLSQGAFTLAHGHNVPKFGGTVGDLKNISMEAYGADLRLGAAQESHEKTL